MQPCALWFGIGRPGLIERQGVGSVARSCCSQLSIFLRTRSKYGSVGCDCCAAGFEGTRGVSLDGVEGVAHPSKSPISTNSAIAIIGRTGGGKSASFVCAALAALLQSASLGVGGGDAGLPFEFDDIAALSIGSEMGEREREDERQGDQHPRVEQETHDITCARACAWYASQVWRCGLPGRHVRSA